MKKINKDILLKNKALLHCIILSIIFFSFVLIITRFEYAYGSSLDWNSQHYAFPDYFRRLFYETGEIFPSFAPNIGGGENIYYFSYYGLFSPFIILSYFFPFIEMNVYIQIVSMAGMWISILLFYRFINRRFNNNTAFISSLLFLLSTPLIFHSHRHIMFVSYMPFLILAFEATDKFIKKNIKWQLIVFTALIIFTSYFFSVSSIISITIYAVYSYLKNNNEFELKKFLFKGLKFAGCIMTAVMISGILLLPTLGAMSVGRESTNAGFSLSALIPFSAVATLTFSPYSFGISLFGILAVISAVLCKNNKSRKFLGIVIILLMSFPVIPLMLNGGMYVDGKVFIPFVPLMLILVSQLYEDFINTKKIPKINYIVLFIYTALNLIFYNSSYDYQDHIIFKMFCIDIAVSSVFLLLYCKMARKVFLILTMTLTTAAGFVLSDEADSLMTKDIIRYNQSLISPKMLEIISADENIVRSSTAVRKSETVNMIYSMDYYSPYVYSSLHNKYYNDFYFNKIENENEYRNNALTTRSSSILFNIFIGNKYLSTKIPLAETGYTQIMQDGELYFYRNDYALPIGRSSNKLISRSDFEKLSAAERMEALVKCIVTEEDAESSYESTCKEYKGVSIPEDSHITFSDGNYIIKSDKEFKVSADLDEKITGDKILIVFMDIINLSDNSDARIKINHCKNTLTSNSWKYYNNNNTFSYVLTTDGNDTLDKLDFVFSDGNYRIDNIEAYTIDYPDNISLTGEFMADRSKTKGDVISGSIDCREDGYFLLTIPYDKGFEITVDGKPQEYGITDCSFIGFPIAEGKHDIEIEYTAPLRKEGIILSVIGLLIFTGTVVFDIRKYRTEH